ncbi:MAG: oligopeptide/dipeptide ABC transporter ATP-binding protein, partial [Pseudomonadota bacterium]
LAVVEAVCDRIAVLYFGSVVELGAADVVFANPQHPYTHLLASSAPTVGRPLAPAKDGSGELPDPLNPPRGCAFADRCGRVQKECRERKPQLGTDNLEHQSACFNPIENG